MMNSKRQEDRELSALLSAMFDGQITGAEQARLGDVLRDNSAAQEAYLDFCTTHALLRQELGGRCGVAALAREEGLAVADESSALLGAIDGCCPFDGPSGSVPFPSIVTQPASDHAPLLSPFGSFVFSYALAALIVGVGMLIGWACKVSVHEPFANAPPTSPTTPIRSQSDLVFVGRVTGTVECKWSDSRTGTVDYAYVPLGRKYALASGLMEITYDSGASVILEGPCTYIVESKTGGYLGFGRLTAKMDDKGDGGRGKREGNQQASIAKQTGAEKPLSPVASVSRFVVRTPTAIVTDLGTEFGVTVDKSGLTESHVFRGRVLMAAAASAARLQDREITLTANQSARIAKPTRGQSLVVRRDNVKAEPASFVRGEQFAARTKQFRELPLKPFRHWQAFSEQLRKRGDVLAYYDFQRDPGDPRDRDGYELLRNRAAGGAKFDGRLVGSVKMGMARGRFRGKDALKFDYPGDGVRINVPGEFPQLTLMASIALERCNGLSGIFMTDDWGRPSQIHWQFIQAGTIKFATPALDGIFQLDASEAANFGRWHVWMVVYDAPGGRCAAYVDGRLLRKWELTKAPSLTIGEATIANWKPQSSWGPRPLAGAIDEFAIFAAALGDADVRQLQESEYEIQQ
jgi:hypothetical protein